MKCYREQFGLNPAPFLLLTQASVKDAFKEWTITVPGMHIFVNVTQSQYVTIFL